MIKSKTKGNNMVHTSKYIKAKNKTNGFTLIELMIVVAIISILAALAIPQYQTYTLRSTVSAQTISAIRPLRLAINEYVAMEGELPASFALLTKVHFFSTENKAYSASELATGMIGSIEWEVNTMTLTFNDQSPALLQNKTLIITVDVDPKGKAIYKPTGGTITPQYYPKL